MAGTRRHHPANPHPHGKVPAISDGGTVIYLQLSGSIETVTAGFFEQEDRTGVPLGVFVHNPAYLARSDAVPLDPFELPLRQGRFETVKLNGIFGALRDDLTPNPLTSLEHEILP